MLDYTLSFDFVIIHPICRSQNLVRLLPSLWYLSYNTFFIIFLIIMNIFVIRLCATMLTPRPYIRSPAFWLSTTLDWLEGIYRSNIGWCLTNKAIISLAGLLRRVLINLKTILVAKEWETSLVFYNLLFFTIYRLQSYSYCVILLFLNNLYRHFLIRLEFVVFSLIKGQLIIGNDISNLDLKLLFLLI